MSTLNRDILQILRCPRCFKYPTVPVHNCMAGHIVCVNCGDGNLRCSVCRCRAESRNYTLETIIDLLEFPCSNAGEGCKELCKRPNLAEHLSVCSYRQYACILDTNEPCQWRGRRQHLKVHALMHHEEKAWMLETSIELWNSLEPDYDVQFVWAFEEMFYMHRQLIRSETGGMMYWVVQYIGKSEDVIQFCYKINFVTDKNKNRSVTYREICHEDLKDVDEMIESGYCVAVALATLETYLDDNGDLWYNVQIEQA